jgi:tetratricopeptide (TPR) repeat protein
VTRGVRFIACGIVAAVAAWTLVLLYQSYVCNVRAKQAERAIRQMFSISDQVSSRIGARRILTDMDHCIRCSPTDVNQYMVRAAALRILDRPAEAALEYRRALHIDRRAELFLNLGLAELEAGREEEAKDALITAVYLLYTYWVDLPQPMQQRVRDAVTPTYAAILERRATQKVIDELRARVAREPR